MGLTPFLKQKNAKILFSDAFKKPKIKLVGDIRAPVISSKHCLLGTAFDYLLKAHLMYHNKNSILENCIAKKSLNLMEIQRNNGELPIYNAVSDEIYEKAKNNFNFAVKVY
jgi:hypothetical protein